MEREVGAGTGMGNTCKPLAISFQCMTKSTTNKKKKKKNICDTLGYTILQSFKFNQENKTGKGDTMDRHLSSVNRV